MNTVLVLFHFNSFLTVFFSVNKKLQKQQQKYSDADKTASFFFSSIARPFSVCICASERRQRKNIEELREKETEKSTTKSRPKYSPN